MKKVVFYIVLSISTSVMLVGFKNHCKKKNIVRIKIDTLSGLFLYGINVPFRCYSRGDEISGMGNLIWFSEDISKKNIAELYKKGIFTYAPSTENIHKAFEKGDSSSVSESKNMRKFEIQAIRYLMSDDSLKSKTLIYDASKNLSYLKIYAKLAVEDLGPMKALIPKTDGYQCCYSNMSAVIETYLIKDIIEFKIIYR